MPNERAEPHPNENAYKIKKKDVVIDTPPPVAPPVVKPGALIPVTRISRLRRRFRSLKRIRRFQR